MAARAAARDAARAPCRVRRARVRLRAGSRRIRRRHRARRRAPHRRSPSSIDAAYHARVQLSATGFYATPKIHYDRTTLTGRPFFYFAYGAAVSEVAIDTLTGEHRLLRGRHPARRRRVAQSGDRPRPDRGRLHPGLGLADDGGALLERRRRARDARAVDVQDSRRRATRRAHFNVDVLRRAQPRGDDPSLQGRRRAAADAGAVRLPRAARRDRQRRRLSPYAALSAPATPERVLAASTRFAPGDAHRRARRRRRARPQ